MKLLQTSSTFIFPLFHITITKFGQREIKVNLVWKIFNQEGSDVQMAHNY